MSRIRRRYFPRFLRNNRYNMFFKNYFSLDGNRWKSRLAKALRISNFELLFESISNNCQAKRSKNREGTSGNIINSYISDWYMCLLPWTKRKFISEKKRDPLITFLTRFLVAETMNSRRENSKLRIVVCRYRLSPLCIEPFFQRNIGAKRRKVASPIFDAFGNVDDQRSGEEKAKKRREKRTRD